MSLEPIGIGMGIDTETISEDETDSTDSSVIAVEPSRPPVVGDDEQINQQNAAEGIEAENADVSDTEKSRESPVMRGRARSSRVPPLPPLTSAAVIDDRHDEKHDGIPPHDEVTHDSQDSNININTREHEVSNVGIVYPGDSDSEREDDHEGDGEGDNTSNSSSSSDEPEPVVMMKRVRSVTIRREAISIEKKREREKHGSDTSDSVSDSESSSSDGDGKTSASASATRMTRSQSRIGMFKGKLKRQMSQILGVDYDDDCDNEDTDIGEEKKEKKDGNGGGDGDIEAGNADKDPTDSIKVERRARGTTITHEGKIITIDHEHGIFRRWLDKIVPPEQRLTVQALVAMSLTYFSLGSVLFFSSSLQRIYLSAVGAQLGGVQVAFLSVVNVFPYILRVGFGVLSDRVRLHFLGVGRRRPYILAGLTICAAGIALVGVVDPTTPKGYSTMVVLSFLYGGGIAMASTAVDGWGIDISQTEEEEGRVQGFMIGGKGLGVAVVALILGALQDGSSSNDWSSVFILLGAMLAPSFVFILFFTTEPPQPKSESILFISFLKTFIDPFILFVGISGALGSFTLFGVKHVANQFVETSVLGESDLTDEGVFTAVAGGMSLVGAIVGQALVRKFNFARAYPIVILVVFAVSMLQAVVPPVYWAAAVFKGLLGLSDGLYQACFFALSMGQCNRSLAATHFSFIYLISFVGTSISETLSPIILVFLGTTGTYFLLGGSLMFQIPIFYALFFSKFAKNKKKKEEKHSLQRRLTMRSMLSLQTVGMTKAMIRRTEEIAERESKVGIREYEVDKKERALEERLVEVEKREKVASDSIAHARNVLKKISMEWNKTRQEAAFMVWRRELEPSLRSGM